MIKCVSDHHQAMTMNTRAIILLIHEEDSFAYTDYIQRDVILPAPRNRHRRHLCCHDEWFKVKVTYIFRTSTKRTTLAIVIKPWCRSLHTNFEWWWHSRRHRTVRYVLPLAATAARVLLNSASKRRVVEVNMLRQSLPTIGLQPQWEYLQRANEWIWMDECLDVLLRVTMGSAVGHKWHARISKSTDKTTIIFIIQLHAMRKFFCLWLVKLFRVRRRKQKTQLFCVVHVLISRAITTHIITEYYTHLIPLENLWEKSTDNNWVFDCFVIVVYWVTNNERRVLHQRRVVNKFVWYRCYLPASLRVFNGKLSKWDS